MVSVNVGVDMLDSISTISTKEAEGFVVFSFMCRQLCGSIYVQSLEQFHKPGTTEHTVEPFINLFFDAMVAIFINFLNFYYGPWSLYV